MKETIEFFLGKGGNGRHIKTVLGYFTSSNPKAFHLEEQPQHCLKEINRITLDSLRHPRPTSCKTTLIHILNRTDVDRRHPSTPHLQSLDEYHQLYQKSIASPGTFWSDMATSLLHWETPFYHVQHGTFEQGDHAWFLGGKLNACYNCVDVMQ